jgi:RNA polymerase sigma-70 factor (ECF subfamily)
VYLDDLRRQARSPVLVEEQDSAAAPDSDLVEQDAIERALGRLPERQRTALLLSDRVGLAGSEVASALGISEGAARVLIHRGRQGFRVAYEEGSG